MGLDTSHDCWHGAYSAFMRWRREVALAAGMPPLDLMEGYYEHGNPIHDPFWTSGLDREDPKAKLDGLPIKWGSLKSSPLHILLQHSDCEGELQWQDCAAIADALEAVLPEMPKGDAGGHIGVWEEKTKQFIAGLRLAASSKEDVDFH